MILYLCNRCGRWQDVTLTQAMSDAFNTFLAGLRSDSSHPSTPEYQCPDGCGVMTLVNAEDRLLLRPTMRAVMIYEETEKALIAVEHNTPSSPS